MIMGLCHQCKAPQCEWTSVRCTKGKDCMEIFCFRCLSEHYPFLYGDVFRGICWACPACSDACHCPTCIDPVKKHELQVLASEQHIQQKAFLRSSQQQVVVNKSANAPSDSSDGSNNWSCPRCSVVNQADEIECVACYYHRKRTARKRVIYTAPPTSSYEEKHSSVRKEPKRAREIASASALLYDDSSPPQKGRVSALRQLVKHPWTDGWELGRKLALDLVEEARQQAIKQGIPVLQVRQLPTKYQLANSRGNHVRKWFDREPTLAKKFLRAAGLICSKSNGTFINQDIPSLDDLPPLILKADLTRYDESSSFSDDGEEISKHPGVSQDSLSSSPSASPGGSPSLGYKPKLKVYYHRSDKTQPFVFKVPITDLHSMEEVKERLSMLLHDMGQSGPEEPESLKKSFILTTGAADASFVAQSPCTSMDDLSKCSLLHVNAP